MAFRNLPEMPCGPILELHGQRKRFHVPFGLKRMIEDMTREVLRYQPMNIYEFLAVFMESRLQRRLNEEEKSQKRKSWETHRWSWQGGSVLEPEDLKIFLEQLPAPEDEAHHHAVVIQAAFRGYQARKMVKENRKTLGADEEKRVSMALGGKKTSGDTDEKDDGSLKRRNTMGLNDENVTEEELQSVVIIQAAFRGMQARNTVKKLRASMGGQPETNEGGRKSQTGNVRQSQSKEGQAQKDALEEKGIAAEDNDATIEQDQNKEATTVDNQNEMETKEQEKDAAVVEGTDANVENVQQEGAVPEDNKNDATGEMNQANDVAADDKQKETDELEENEEEEEEEG